MIQNYTRDYFSIIPKKKKASRTGFMHFIKEPDSALCHFRDISRFRETALRNLCKKGIFPEIA